MGNSGALSFTGGVDVSADRYMVDFQMVQVDTDEGSEEVSLEPRTASTIQVQAGPEPGYCLCEIDATAFPGFEQHVPFTIATQKDVGYGQPNIRATVSVITGVGSKKIPLLTGTVISMKHSLDGDSIMTTIVDDKWYLNKFTVMGQAQYDPSKASNKEGYVSAARCVFNEFGYPNKINTPNGPRFAPTVRWGWLGSQNDEDDALDANKVSKSAGFWTAPDACRYLWDVHYSEGNFTYSTIVADWFLKPKVQSKYLNWAASMGDALRAVNKTSGGDEDIVSRPLHNCSVEGMTLLGALTKIGRKAGPYEINCRATSSSGSNASGVGSQGGRSTLEFISLDKNRAGVTLYHAGIAGDDLTAAVKSNSISGGYIEESIRDYFHSVAIAGDPPVIERLVSQKTGTLEPAWSTADESAFTDYINTNGKTAAAYQEATMLWPMVFAAYRIAETFDYLAGTKWSAFTSSRIRKHPKIRPFLVTGLQVDEDNPRDWIPRQITIEYEHATDTWRPTPPRDGLQVSLDGGYFIVDGLRDMGNVESDSVGDILAPNHPTWSGKISDPTNMTARNIRLTVAIECDFRLGAIAGDNFDPNGTYARVLNAEGEQVKTKYVISSPPLDYVEWLRLADSAPFGSQVAIPDGFPDKSSATALIESAGANTELFSDRPGTVAAPGKHGRMMQHTLNRLRDVKRIEHKGQIAMEQYEPGLVPGVSIRGMISSGIRINTVITGYTIESSTQKMVIMTA